MNDKLLGTWSLKSWIASDDKGNKIYPLSENAKGFIMYTGDGYMSATIMNPDMMQNLSSGMSLKTIGSGGGSYLSYAGSYSIEGDVATHHVEIACIPEMIGTKQLRYFKVEGDTLTINSETPLPNGSKASHTLIWVKK